MSYDLDAAGSLRRTDPVLPESDAGDAAVAAES
jgi:hypothetical protein